MHARSTSRHEVKESARIAAPAGDVYAVLADYRDGHPKILPTEYFRDLRVEQGGVGAGTTIQFEMRVLGHTRHVRAAVTEPEPGRVLTESDHESGTVTTFTVEPTADGRATDVTIATSLPARGGVVGSIERRLTSMLLRRIYVRELALLAAFVGSRTGARSPK